MHIERLYMSGGPFFFLGTDRLFLVSEHSIILRECTISDSIHYERLPFSPCFTNLIVYHKISNDENSIMLDLMMQFTINTVTERAPHGAPFLYHPRRITMFLLQAFTICAGQWPAAVYWSHHLHDIVCYKSVIISLCKSHLLRLCVRYNEMHQPTRHKG